MKENNIKNNTINSNKDKAKKYNNNSDKKKIGIVNPIRFAIVVLVFIAIAILVIVLIRANTRINITEVNDISKLNAKKYANEILIEYQKDDTKQKFIDDYDLIQGAIGLYIMNNSTNSPDSFSNIINDLKSILNEDDWSKLEIDKPNFWNGSFSVDENGILKFTFSLKEIEPSWVNDEDIVSRVILNN